MRGPESTASDDQDAGGKEPLLSRFADLMKNGKVPADILAKLPPAESYDKAVFPTLDEQGAGKEVVTKQWDTVVGAVVK